MFWLIKQRQQESGQTVLPYPPPFKNPGLSHIDHTQRWCIQSIPKSVGDLEAVQRLVSYPSMRVQGSGGELWSFNFSEISRLTGQGAPIGSAHAQPFSYHRLTHGAIATP